MRPALVPTRIAPHRVVAPSGLAPSVPGYVRASVRRSGGAVTAGIPNRTWNGMTAQRHALGARDGSTRQVRLLPPGVHPVSAAEAKQRFAWNEQRLALWRRLEQAAPEILERYKVTHLAGGGSFFSTDFALPGDMDLIAFTPPDVRVPRAPRDATAFGSFNRHQTERGVHLYLHDESIFFPGGPSSLSGFLHAPPNPRPARPTLGGPKGPRVGLALLEVADLIAQSRRG